ncbi:hypothetical protein [Mesorhizobium ciceri]|uniref:hypothetical protein n=1 Tax=Mesorhizobium TaxID=68287 RepID=UPI0004B23C5C|nr:hypothetical protein [Mesorhizobium ciceri]
MSDGGSVFPQLLKAGDHAISEGGMSLRDWFAGQALIEIANVHIAHSPDTFEAEKARRCYAMADAMLAEGSKAVPSAPQPTDEQIKHMVSRFLQWRLPENFIPDGGVSFTPSFNEEPMRTRHWPIGTNVLDAVQAEAMVRHMLDGMPK